MKKVAHILLIFILSTGIGSCRRNHYKVNTSSISVKIEIKRLEQDLFTMNPNEINSAVPSLKKKYNGFLQLFSYVINTGDINDPSFGDFLVRFCTDRQNNEVYALTMKVFPDVKLIGSDLEDAFRHYLYYLPGKHVPEIFTCTSGFNNSIITGDSAIGISLDRYLGSDCEYYPRLGIYSYISAKMTPENIVPDCMYGWISSEWEFKGEFPSIKYSADNVMTEIIHYGKLKYFEKCMLPEKPDNLIFGFTQDQMKFCRNNEDQMWQYLIENDMLFKTDQFIINKLTGEAPFTSYFTNESPGKAAVWLGFRIIESYMMKNPGVRIEELMNETDVQSLLEKAKYDPH